MEAMDGRVAVLLVFPPGVSEEEARRLIEAAVRREIPGDKVPTIQASEVYDPEDHPPVIYIP